MCPRLTLTEILGDQTSVLALLDLSKGRYFYCRTNTWSASIVMASSTTSRMSTRKILPCSWQRLRKRRADGTPGRQRLSSRTAALRLALLVGVNTVTVVSISLYIGRNHIGPRRGEFVHGDRPIASDIPLSLYATLRLL